MKLEVCIDVDDVARAVAFYGRGLGLAVVAQHPRWAQLELGEQTLWIVKKQGLGPAGTGACDYRRHWTPVHLDFVVDDLDSAVERALAAGGRLDRGITRNEAEPCGRHDLANLSDPAGNGVDLIQRHPSRRARTP